MSEPRRSPRTTALAAWLSITWQTFACQPAAPVLVSAAPQEAPPVPAPRPSITGCVESAELKRFVLALEARRHAARAAALTELRARATPRAATLGEVGQALVLDGELESEGRRWVVVAQVAATLAPEVALVQVGGVLHRVVERPRTHPAPLVVCGLQRCERARPAQVSPPVRPVLVELQPGERWGGPLELEYDAWWADVRYDRAETCPPGAPAQPRVSSELSETP